MDKMCTLYLSNCNQEEVNYLPMFVMPHLEQTDINVTAPITVRSNFNQEQIQYLRMFVMQNLERNDVNMTYHVSQTKKNTIKTQLMT
ncbi:hypothetical protein T09_2757 [Trichinella sp. T9]|nr:hypothetical protein T09_2757 [Trichinella sp. T9]